MAIVCEVKFSPNSRTFFYDATEFSDLKKGDEIIVEHSDSIEFAVVSKKPYETKDEKIIASLEKIKRMASKKDKDAKRLSQEKNKGAYKDVLDAVKKFDLQMKLVEVRYSFDGSKIFINYIAENRVDFRELVKYLASIFKTRVELRQISQREEAKMFGGCGICGKELCCSKFLGDNAQVSIKMAKAQNLALNPSKINGVCGKLMCCLGFESKEYQEVLDKMPAIGETIKTKECEGVVVYQDLLNEKVTIKISSGDEEKMQDVKLEEILKEG